MLNKFQNSLTCFLYRNGKSLPPLIFQLINFFNKKYKLSKSVNDQFLITSESGIWITRGTESIQRIIPCYSFGIALDTERIYFSISSEKNSDVLSIAIKKNKLVSKPIRHYSQQTLYHNEKIHQISIYDKYLYIANTCCNAITILEKQGTKNSKRLNIYPFKDKTGYPISKDHNHINALQPLKDGIIFTAHNGGNLGSIIGVIYKSSCVMFPYKNRGIHDILVDQENIIFSDSFGKPEINFKGMKKYGSISLNNQTIEQNSHFTRGIYLGKNKNYTGSSFHGKREIRFSGRGSLIETDKNFNPISEIELPFSQVHDLIGLDGERKSNKINLSNLTSETVLKILRNCFGDSILVDNYYVEEFTQNKRTLYKNNLEYKELLLLLK